MSATLIEMLFTFSSCNLIAYFCAQRSSNNNNNNWQQQHAQQQHVRQQQQQLRFVNNENSDVALKCFSSITTIGRRSAAMPCAYPVKDTAATGHATPRGKSIAKAKPAYVTLEETSYKQSTG